MCYKIIVIGNSSAGNGALINRYVNNVYEPGDAGNRYWGKNIFVDGNYLYFKIYDAICSCCRFGRSFNINRFHGIIIIFDVADKVTLLNVENYLNDIRICTKNKLDVILVGDQSKSNRIISIEEATEYASKNNMHYFDISIIDNKGVDDIFTYIATEIYHHQIIFK